MGSHEVGGALGSLEVDTNDAPPLTFSTLGRFFAVPMVIIGTIVGGAILVVLFFGGPAAPQQHSVDHLLQVLEASSGARSMGLLMPKEKALWQTALELTVRLENKDKDADLAQSDLARIATRISAMVQADLSELDRLSPIEEGREQRRAIRSRRLRFLILALGRTERPEAIETLLTVLRDGDGLCQTAAIQALGRMHEVPEARATTDEITAALSRANSPELRLMACTVLSVLSARGDAEVIAAVKTAYRTGEGEVEWNCALALARLGSDAGKSTLLDLLDRSFLESGARYEVRDESGVVHRHPLPPARVDALLVAAMEAAMSLDDLEVWRMIEALASSDRSPAVRGRATAIIKDHNG